MGNSGGLFKMNKEYICIGCGALYTIEDLEDNFDGTCYYCDCPLVPLNEESAEVNKMIDELRHYPMESLWHSIEKSKDPKARLKFRGYFFKALKVLGKTFELQD